LKILFILSSLLGTTYTQVKPNGAVRPRVVKTVSNRMVGARTFKASAYSLKGKTTSGERTRHGIIAADPRVLPLGTRVHIQGMGLYVVKDTGGAIKGERIDIWMSEVNAIKFGRRSVQLTVLR
jgi:3D (Asp-Asp-Asp) domain-containing protein